MPKTTTPLGDFPILPFQPETPISERLEWLTDLFLSHNGTESRYQLRQSPRRYFEYTIPLSAWKRIQDLNMIKGGSREIWLFPIWTEAQFVGDITGGAEIIPCDGYTNYWYEDDSLCMLYSANDQSTQILQVEANAPTYVEVYPPGASSMFNAWIMPLKQGVLVGNPTHQTNGLNSTVLLKIQLTETCFFRTENPPGNNFYDLRSLGSSGFLSRIIEQKQDLFDEKLGPIYQRSPWDFANYTLSHKMILNNPSDIWEFKNWLYNSKGRLNSFFLPTYEIDMKLQSTGTITTVLLVDSGSIIDFATNRVQLAILDTSDNYHLVGITNFTQLDSDTVQLDLDSTLNLDASEIKLISYLSHTRLSSDTVEFSWIGNGVVKTAVSLVEIKL